MSAVLSKLRRIAEDPVAFCERLFIIDKNGRKFRFGDVMHPEQRVLLETLRDHQRVAVLKARQIGTTTTVTAFMTWLGLWGYDGQYNWLSITHEQDAQFRVNQMIRNYAENLPQALMPGLGLKGVKKLSVPFHDTEGNLTREPMWAQIVAGGRGAGRSFTYQGLHATEMGFWPRGSSATASKGGADDNVFASAQATLNLEGERWGRVVLESTADGPGGIFHRMWRTAVDSDAWATLFFPWTHYDRYQLTPPADFELTDDEARLQALHGITDAQLAWRRSKIVDAGYGLRRFQREYPMTALEPFTAAEGMWFDVQKLLDLEALLPLGRIGDKRRDVRYYQPDPDYRYVVAVDSAGGAGADEEDKRDRAVVTVLSDDMRQVARWHSRTKHPIEQAEQAYAMSKAYGNALIICERQRYGGVVVAHLVGLGANVWYDTDKKAGWWSTDVKKRQVYTVARQYIDGGHVDIQCPFTIRELAAIRETDKAKIEAEGENHDDHADAIALAIYLARGTYRAGRELTPAERRERARKDFHRGVGS